VVDETTSSLRENLGAVIVATVPTFVTTFLGPFLIYDFSTPSRAHEIGVYRLLLLIAGRLRALGLAAFHLLISFS
jgi:hypothetical protein